MPDVSKLASMPVSTSRGGEEGRSLLRDTNAVEVVRPQVKYGRMVAGEAFELGDDEDSD
jgi:hypothetical protein